MTVFLDTQLLVTIGCLKWAQASSWTHCESDADCGCADFLALGT